MNLYKEHGYSNRGEYLKELAEEYDVPLYSVLVAADMLGPDEDFDGLVSFIQDMPF